MEPKIIADRIIKSMQEYPDKWRLEREGGKLWAKHVAKIDVGLEGGYWIDINDDHTLQECGAPISLGFWQHRRVRQAGQALIREKIMRILDRNELLEDES